MCVPWVSVVDEAGVSFPRHPVWLFLCKHEVNVGAFYANAKDVGKGTYNFHHKCVSKFAIF